ncbi:SIR2 family NAD-dependent protein deacylase [Leadbettera azotonutricia]|uniref:protein acetyllysine N-acetyltransferase n=1 Tax=Leadbettera azotonutricia (strain ATCC BAA-888 / DSM 13862 / ZAS-9) TaxID=545695 RepID=F5YE92_LEAAZ|nr:Sir2 family NAD-dependent protein deacetylase [Leadbettera azotonutricia]AEF81933.1 NAD-dependent deacetylase [Leadbettera azotonutricia ZAS-9]
MNAGNEITGLYEKISHARHCVGLTGAGVSTLSGIRDFRGKNGLYNEMDAEKIFDIRYFEKDPAFYYQKAGSFIYNIDEKEPSVVHTVLGDLEALGFVKALITQNIDLLHTKGGSKKVIEIHGSPKIHYCMHCSGIRMPFDEAAALVKAGKFPICPKCGRILKPAITFFGENLPIDALNEAVKEAQEADLMLILGTSLTVNPAASLPGYTLRNGGDIIIVNNMPTPMDDAAILHFEDLGEVFEGLRQVMEKA